MYILENAKTWNEPKQGKDTGMSIGTRIGIVTSFVREHAQAETCAHARRVVYLRHKT